MSLIVLHIYMNHFNHNLFKGHLYTVLIRSFQSGSWTNIAGIRCPYFVIKVSAILGVCVGSPNQ